MADLTPTPKIAATTLAGAGAVLLVWILGLLGLDVPDAVAAAIAVLIAAGAGYLKQSAPPS